MEREEEMERGDWGSISLTYVTIIWANTHPPQQVPMLLVCVVVMAFKRQTKNTCEIDITGLPTVRYYSQ